MLDISNDIGLNKYTPEDERPVPFRNMIYIGDGLTDVPCIKANGGYSIAVYKKGKRSKVEDLLRDKRVDYILPADYSAGEDLENTVQDMIGKIALEDFLKRKSNEQTAPVAKE